MKKTMIAIACATSVVCASGLLAKGGMVRFFSKTSIMDIEGVTKTAVSSLDLDSGKIVIKSRNTTYIFPDKLMQEHFNENYMESEKFPVSSFSGTVTAMDHDAFNAGKKVTVVVDGILDVHGVGKHYRSLAYLQKGQNGAVVGDTKFFVKMADHGIKIPSVVAANLCDSMQMKTPLFLLLLCLATAHAQDLDAALESVAPSDEPVQATFKGIRVVESQSVETTQKGVLNGTISHRFGQYATGFDNLYGLDFASMRIGLDYGFAAGTDIGFERSTNDGKPIDLFLKQRLIRQTTTGSVPLSITWYAAGYMMTKTGQGLPYDLSFERRLSSTNQLIMARKFTEDLSLQVSPTMVTRQLRPNNGDGEVALGIGLGGRYKVAQRIAITAETTPMFYGVSKTWDPACALGIDIETGGHVFQLFISNSTFISEDRMYTQTKTGPHTALDVNTLSLGFNITRGYSL